MAKIEREILRKLLDDALSVSVTFKHIEGINPCSISFDGAEYFVYIKNLSPAQLSNNNPDIWRIQLPIRDIFEEIKESSFPFILLGYDAENDIYTTWNPHWVKQRLNVAKSVSFYSRLSVQENARIENQFQRQELNNDGEVLAFPREKIPYFLINMGQFFPDMSEYVAMGSRKRIEANEAYKLFSDTKNIADFAHYLTLNELSQTTISNYCLAIRKLINEGYISRYRKIFLAYDSIADYPQSIKPFITIPEITAINDVWHNTYSAALNKYIKFLMEVSNVNIEDDYTKEDIKGSKQDYPNELFDLFCNANQLDGFRSFLNRKQLSERSVNTYVNTIAKLIKEGLFDRYKNAFLQYNCISDYSNAIEKFLTIPEILELNNLWEGVFSAALRHYIQFLVSCVDSIVTEPSTTNTNQIITVDTKEIEQSEDEAPEEDEIIDWEDEFTNDQGKLTRIANPILIDELRPNLDTEYRAIPTALIIVENFYKERFPAMELKDWQKLFDQIDWSNPYYTPSDSNNDEEQEGKRKTHILRVTFPNGSIIQEKKVSDTLFKVVKYAGADYVRSLNINTCGENMIVSESEINPRYAKATKQIKDDLYVNTCSDTQTKYNVINKISKELDLDLQVDFVSVDNKEVVSLYPKTSTRAKIKVTFPDGKTIQYAKVLETLIEVIHYAGVEKVHDLDIRINNDNLITNNVTPTYQISLKPLGNGLFVHTNSATDTKLEQIQRISDDLKLNLIAELV